MIRTDMAWENKALWEQSGHASGQLGGVVTQEKRLRGFLLKTVEITSEEGAHALGKPMGVFHTLDVDAAEPKLFSEGENTALAVAELLRPLIERRERVLIAGLGNEAITPDAIGPRTLKNVIITRHLKSVMQQKLPMFRSVCAAEPGVLGATGTESAEIVRALVNELQIEAVVAIDALATNDPTHICRSIQITDTGIEPGSGVGNRRARISEETLGVPVIAVGVPTLTDYDCDGLIIIPRDMDRQIARMARYIGCGINLALHPGIDYADIPRFLP